MRRLRSRIRRWCWRGAIAALLVLVATNGAVRACGGNPFWLSPFFLRQKVQALLALSVHLAQHPFKDCEPAPALLRAAARRYRVAPELAFAVARAESGLAPHRISRAGAMGVMQLMPATARQLAVRDPFDPRQNIDGGVRYLGSLLRRYAGDRRRAVAAYNAGPGRIPKSGPLFLSPETRLYVRRVVQK